MCTRKKNRMLAAAASPEDEAFNRVAGDIARQIAGIQANAKQIEALAQGVGSPKDGAPLRQQLHSLTHTTRALCQAAADGLRTQLAPLCTGLTGGVRKVQKDKLVDQLAKAAGDFQEAQRLVQGREREIAARQRQAAGGLEAAINGAPMSGGDSEDTNPFGFASVTAQQQLQDQQQARADLQAAEERESQLRQLEQDIVGINEMFKDLAQMVHEQGDMLDSIEDHVNEAVTQVEEGNKNLKQAVTYQKSARRKKIIIAVVVIVALAVLAIIIYFAVPKGK